MNPINQMEVDYFNVDSLIPGDIRLRDEEINNIFKIHDAIVNLLPVDQRPFECAVGEGPVVIDIDMSSQVAWIAMKVFTYMRKASLANTSGTATANRFVEYKVTAFKKEINIKDLAISLLDSGLNISFPVAAPIINILTAFKCAFKELRGAVTKFEVVRETVKRTSDGARAQPMDALCTNIFSYGLNLQHLPLLRGLTFPPETRTRLLTSLGPMTQAILLVNERRYPNRIVNALKHSLAFLPMKEELITAFRYGSSPGQEALLMKELGDLLSITTSSTTNRIFFPLSVWRFLWSSKPNDFQWSFSGVHMHHLFTRLVMTKRLQYRIRTHRPSEEMNQIIFHATFGIDDLGVLSQITNCESWKIRSEISTNLRALRASAPSKTFEPIYFQKVAKMKSIKTQCNIGAMRIPLPGVFAGFRQVKIPKEFIHYLKTGQTVKTFSSDPISLQAALKEFKDDLIEDSKHYSCIESWMDATQDQLQPLTDFVPKQTSFCFYGKSNLYMK